MGEKPQLEELSKVERDYISPFFVVLFSAMLSDLILSVLSDLVPGLFTALARVFQELTLSIALFVLFLAIIRLLVFVFPFFAIDNPSKWYFGAVTLLLLYHPLLITLQGSRPVINWLVIDIFEYGEPLDFIIETVLFVVAGFLAYLILARSGDDGSSSLEKYFKYLGKEMVYLMFILYFVYSLLRSFIVEDFETITLTTPIKLILIFLLYFGFYPSSPKAEPTEESQASE